MRLLRGSLPLIIVLLVGCHNQPTTMTNPFLAPDRVPPPSTRALQPGTAQPYYPGDSLPGAPAAGAPQPTYNPASGYGAPTSPWPAAPANAPQQTPYTPSPSYGVSPTSAQIPLGPQEDSLAALAAVTAVEAVSVPDDEQRMRFAAASNVSSVPPSSYSSQTIAPATADAGSATQLQSQTILPTPQVPAAPAVQQSSSDFVSGQSSFQPAQLRAVAPAEYYAPVGSAPQATGSDGFRPQGSSERSDLAQTTSYTEQPFADASSPWQSPAATQQPTPGATARFGMGPTYEWLRGQLVYSGETNQWRVVYMPEGSQPDQLGGSVAVANPQLLANLQPGEFVMVRGQLYNLQNEQNAFMPVYQLAGVQRQSE